jgi:hypothetical protein
MSLEHLPETAGVRANAKLPAVILAIAGASPIACVFLLLAPRTILGSLPFVGVPSDAIVSAATINLAIVYVLVFKYLLC